MKKEDAKQILNKRFRGQIMSPASIIDIIADYVELMKQYDIDEIEQNKQIESKKVDTRGGTSLLYR